MEPVICPSCGSKYNPETRELVEDTKLRERIRALEAENEQWRTATAEAQAEVSSATAKLTAAEAQLAVLSTPKKSDRKFIVGHKS